MDTNFEAPKTLFLKAFRGLKNYREFSKDMQNIFLCFQMVLLTTLYLDSNVHHAKRSWCNANKQF